MKIEKSSWAFLKDLRVNNSREWFEVNKDRYLDTKANMEALADSVLDGLKKEDVIETPTGRKALYRIYRDTRFSKDKSPYKSYWGGHFRRSGADRRGGLAFSIEPGGSHIAGGFWGPGAKDLLHIRRQIALDPGPLMTALQDPRLKSIFGSMRGAGLKTAPKGFPKDHPHIELLRFKQYLLYTHISDEEVLSDGLDQLMIEGFSAMRPFLDAMTEYLITDLNGEDILSTK